MLYEGYDAIISGHLQAYNDLPLLSHLHLIPAATKQP